MGNWSDLHKDLLIDIASRFTCCNDFVRFCGVCSSWRSIATQHNFVVLRQFPYLMLGQESTSSQFRGFVDVLHEKGYGMVLPEAHNKSCYASRGWLITVGAEDLAMNLLHPKSGIQINLPHPKNLSAEIFEYYYRWPTWNWNIHMLLHKASLSSSPFASASDNLDCILMGIFHGNSKLAYCRLGDDAWTMVESDQGQEIFDDVIYCKGQFYGITGSEGKIFACDIGTVNSSKAKSISSLPKAMVSGCIEKLYLVEDDPSSESLLVVSRKKIVFLPQQSTNYRHGFRYTFQVFEFNMSNNNWRETKSIGNNTLFLGQNTSGSLKASDFPGCKANCVYFTDDFVDTHGHRPRGGVMDMNIYHLEDGTFERYSYTGKSYSHISPPMWIVPSFYFMGKWVTPPSNF